MLAEQHSDRHAPRGVQVCTPSPLAGVFCCTAVYQGFDVWPWDWGCWAGQSLLTSQVILLTPFRGVMIHIGSVVTLFLLLYNGGTILSVTRAPKFNLTPCTATGWFGDKIPRMNTSQHGRGRANLTRYQANTGQGGPGIHSFILPGKSID